MGRDNHFNAVLFNRLTLLIEQKDYASLTEFLERLSNSQYRTAGYVLGERIGISLPPESFWELFVVLVRFDAKAFLVTMLKSFVEGMKRGKLSLADKGFKNAALLLKQKQIDAQKTLLTLLPIIDDVQQIRMLFGVMGYEEMSSWVTFLLRSFHPSTAFVLLQALHYVEQDRSLLLRVGQHLMSRGDSLSFNVASLIKSIYGLDELQGTFSLRLEPFQLSRIETSYEAFCEAVSLR